MVIVQPLPELIVTTKLSRAFIFVDLQKLFCYSTSTLSTAFLFEKFGSLAPSKGGQAVVPTSLVVMIILELINQDSAYVIVWVVSSVGRAAAS
jgi:hypothetical protein